VRNARPAGPGRALRAARVLLRTHLRGGEARRAGRPGLYYGWPMLIALSVAETLSWGILYYSFSVFIRPIEIEMGWSRPQVTGAFSLSLLAAGLAAIPVGHWADARGARGLMTAGSVLGALLLLALSSVRSLTAFYTVWAGLGAIMAMVLYEPAFAIVATWFVRHRDRALTILTLFGGLASALLVPLATRLLESQGWRGAVVVLALILACTTIPLHGLMLPSHPAAVGQQPDGEPAATEGALRVRPAEGRGLGPIMAEGRFWAITGAFALASLVTVGTSVHVIPYLTAKGVSATTAGTVLGLTGLMQLPGRLVFSPIRQHWAWHRTAAAVFLTQATALVALAYAADGTGLVVFVALFGLGNGMSTLLRASTLAELYGPGRYGRVSGILAFFSTLGRAAGPVITSLTLVALGSYERAFASLALLLSLATALVLVQWKGSSPQKAEPTPIPFA
jgi:MFS family permease